MITIADVEWAFSAYNKKYPSDNYKPRGVTVWLDYNSFWAVFNSHNKAFPCKLIYAYALNQNTDDRGTSNFFTGDAIRELKRCEYLCKII